MTDRLTRTFAALADPTRRAILARLATGEAGVNDIAAPFDISVQAVSRHLKVLEEGGLITRTRRAQSRPCRFRAAPLQEVHGWLDQYRGFWEGTFDKLAAHAETLDTKETRDDTDRD